jgi:zinc protease
LARARTSDPRLLAERASRRARSPLARVEFVAAVPFGSRLKLHRYQLGNGLRLLALPDRSTPLLSYHTWYRVGSRNERKGKTGLAHLFEHLMFNETRNLPAGEYDRKIESAGGETNASTWTDWTQYHSELPASELSMIVALEAERMKNLVLRDKPVRSEKEVVINERRFRVEDDVEGTTYERLYALALRGHPYGHPTIGWMEDIEGFTIADCTRFYRTYYAPNNATVIAVGGFDEAQLLALVQRHYGVIRPARIPPYRPTPLPPQRAERKKVLRLQTPTEKLTLAYRAPAFSDPDYAVLSLINELLFIGRSSRMYQRLVRKDQLAADVHAGIAPFIEPALLDIWVGLRPGKRAREALRAVEDELARMCRERVSGRDLARVKSRAELGFLMAMETAAGKAEQIGFYETVLGDAGQIFERLALFRAVTADDVLRVARRVFDLRSRTRIEVMPKRGARVAAVAIAPHGAAG